MKRNLILGCITAALLLAGILGCLAIRHHASGTIAVIRQDGEEVRRIDLSAVTEAYTILLTGENGEENIIFVEPGAISMQHASCPDGLCTRMPRLTGQGIPIVCLPHHIVIEVTGGETSGIDIQAY